MNSQITPHFIRKIDGVNLLWFKNSNQYLVFNNETLELFNCFLKSKDLNQFHDLLNSNQFQNISISSELYNEFEELSETLQQKETLKKQNSVKFLNKNWLVTFYLFGNNVIKINYASQNEKNLIHPQFAHLECLENKQKTVDFYIDKADNQLIFFINKKYVASFKDTEYHLLQGKFAMELLCFNTKTKESDWLGTFHASTIANSQEAIMLVGESGSGKSTLTAMLMANGYNLMADDFTPILAKSQKIYPYASAISIKEGAFNVIDSLFKKTDYRSHISLNPKKGVIRYVSPKNTSGKSPLSCSKIVLVNYSPEIKTEFKKIGLEDVLPILIPDSWLSPIPENANWFLNWLEQVQVFELSYSNNEEAVYKFDTLFKNESCSF